MRTKAKEIIAKYGKDKALLVVEDIINATSVCTGLDDNKKPIHRKSNWWQSVKNDIEIELKLIQ